MPCNREGKVAEPILNITFAPDAHLAAREVRVRRVGGGMPRNGMPCAVARSVCCSRRAAMNGAFIQHATAECRLHRLKPCRGERYSVVCVTTLYGMVTLAIRIAYV